VKKQLFGSGRAPVLPALKSLLYQPTQPVRRWPPA